MSLLRILTIADSEPAFDRATLKGLQELIGADAIASLLNGLSHQLHEFGTALTTVEDRSVLGQQAHKVVSAAGMLGFADLSDACAELETTCASGDQFGPALERVRHAQAAALALMEELRPRV